MQKVDLNRIPDGFQVVAQSRRSQAATLVLGARERTGGPGNRHGDSDQWLLVLAGTGRAKVADREVDLAPGLLLLIEAGETHEIESDPANTLRTVNIYTPPEY